jgi:hypothetical protein
VCSTEEIDRSDLKLFKKRSHVNFESFSGSEGVLKAQTTPFPVLLDPFDSRWSDHPFSPAAASARKATSMLPIAQCLGDSIATRSLQFCVSKKKRGCSSGGEI